MRFPSRFIRSVNGTNKALGSDVAPTDATYLTNDNVFTTRLNSTNGYPVNRVVIGCNAPSGASAIAVMVYVYEDVSKKWFPLTDTAQNITPNGGFLFFRHPTLIDTPQVRGDTSNPGSLEVAIVVSLPTTAPDGDYLFIVGGDLGSY